MRAKNWRQDKIFFSLSPEMIGTKVLLPQQRALDLGGKEAAADHKKQRRTKRRIADADADASDESGL